MSASYAHLGVYSDWAAAAAGPRAWAARPDRELVRRLVSEVLAVPGRGRGSGQDGQGPADVQVERRWRSGGLAGEEISYSAGYGPRTRAWVLRPAGSTGRLPGVLALHGHDGFKYYGKEKIADGPEPPSPVLASLRQHYYQGRAFANDLASRGFVVLVPDVFGWGSRRFPLAQMPPLIQRLGELTAGTTPPDTMPGQVPDEIARYNAAAWHHEHLIA
jgi:hypothetical protein